MRKINIFTLVSIFILSGCVSQQHRSSDELKENPGLSFTLCSDRAIDEVFERLFKNSKQCIEKSNINDQSRLASEVFSNGLLKIPPRGYYIHGDINETHTEANIVVIETGGPGVQHLTEISKSDKCVSELRIYDDKNSKISLKTSELITKWVEEDSNEC